MLTVLAMGALVVVAVLAVTPAGPWILHSKAAAGSGVVASQYTCDLSDYGYTGPPVTMTASGNAAETATAVAQTGFSALFGYSGPRSFLTSAAVLPASVASQLTDLGGMSLVATVPVLGAPAASPEAKIYGNTPDAYLPTGPLTALPIDDAFATAFFSSPGTARLEFPAKSLLFTPYRNGKALPAISCHAAAGAPVASEVTVTTAPPVTPTASATSTASATGTVPATATASAAPSAAAGPTTQAGQSSLVPAYGCTSTYRTPTYRTPLPMTITTAGALTVGRRLTVTLSSPVTGLAAPAPGLATKLTFTGTLAVTGAQSGGVKLNQTTTDAGNPLFAVSGQLALTTAGTDTISFPRRFVYTVGLQGSRKALFRCALASSPAPVALTVQVVP